MKEKTHLEKLKEFKTKDFPEHFDYFKDKLLKEFCEAILKDEAQFRKENPYASKHEYIEFMQESIKRGMG